MKEIGKTKKKRKGINKRVKGRGEPFSAAKDLARGPLTVAPEGVRRRSLHPLTGGAPRQGLLPPLARALPQHGCPLRR
jgi:hypothetical protein